LPQCPSSGVVSSAWTTALRAMEPAPSPCSSTCKCREGRA
jgi:hypothetical protein